MARLIDVEPFDLISFHATGDTAYDQGFEDGVQFIAEKLDAAPTVDAIPVEWLKQKSLEGNDPFNPYMMVMYAWFKENKAYTEKRGG